MRISFRLPSRRAVRAGVLLRVLTVAAGLATASIVGAADADKSSALWSAHIQPLFSQHCFKCHGEVKQKGELDLTTLPAMLKGGESGAGSC